MRLSKAVPALAAVAATAMLGATPAHAYAPAIVGHLCDVTPVSDPSGAIAAPGIQTAEIQGGPVSGYDADDPADVAEVYLFCTIQVGGTGRMSDPDVASAESEGDGMTVVNPTLVQFAVAENETIFSCVEIWIFTGSGHLTVYQDNPTGTWVNSPEEANCLVIDISPPPTGAS